VVGGPVSRLKRAVPAANNLLDARFWQAGKSRCSQGFVGGRPFKSAGGGAKLSAKATAVVSGEHFGAGSARHERGGRIAAVGIAAVVQLKETIDLWGALDEAGLVRAVK